MLKEIARTKAKEIVDKVNKEYPAEVFVTEPYAYYDDMVKAIAEELEKGINVQFNSPPMPESEAIRLLQALVKEQGLQLTLLRHAVAEDARAYNIDRMYAELEKRHEHGKGQRR
jgi:hypothetical protein